MSKIYEALQHAYQEKKGDQKAARGPPPAEP